MSWHAHTFTSEALRGNPLGDPHERPLHVWAPEDASRRYPSVYVIQGHDGHGATRGSTSSRGARRIPTGSPRSTPTRSSCSSTRSPPSAARSSRLARDRQLPHLSLRRARAVRRRALPDVPAAAHRGIQGKSSGGYGAMITPLLRPDLFGGLATHAGDALFEVCYARDFAPAARALREDYGGSFDAFWADFRSGRPVLASPHDEVLVNTYAMAAALLGPRRRDRRPAVRHRDRRADRRRSGSAGCASTRCGSRARPNTPDAAEHAGDLDRLGPATTSTTSTSARPRSTVRSSPRGRRPTACTSSSSTARTAA